MTRPCRRALSLCTAAMLLLGTACSFEYGDSAATTSGGTERIADFIMDTAEYTIERTGEHAIILTAERLQMFESEHRALLSEVSFLQRDSRGEVVATGTCDIADIDTNQSDAELSGNIAITATVRQAQLFADHLQWDNSNRTLYSGNNEMVKVVYDDGSVVRGIGFKGDFTLQDVTFQEILEGRVQYE